MSIGFLIKIKEKEKKINNDLVVWPSHDTQVLKCCPLRQITDKILEWEKGKYEEAEKFVTKIKEIQEEAKAALGKVQEKMKKYADRKRAEVDEYKVGDMARKLFGWLDKRYNEEYWARLERNWR